MLTGGIDLSVAMVATAAAYVAGNQSPNGAGHRHRPRPHGRVWSRARQRDRAWGSSGSTRSS